MTAPNRRRPRSTCVVPSRRRAAMTTAAAMSLLALLQSSTMTEAFGPPPSAVRLRQHSSLTEQHASAAALAFDGEGSSSSSFPIRTNQPLSRLTEPEEVSLLRQMRCYPATSSVSQMARQTLMLHNLPLVQSIVTKILRSRPHLLKGPDQQVGVALTRDDLVNEGAIGLAEAIDRYDLAYAVDSGLIPPGSEFPSSSPPSIIPQGARLGTYATYWIRARVVRAIQSREHALRFPEYVLQASHRLVRAAKDMGIKWDAVAEVADYDVITVAQKKLRDGLIEASGIKSESLFREAVRVRSLSRSGSTTQLESWLSPSALTSSAVEEEDGLPSLEGEGGQEHIRETLSKFLVPREVEVLSLRYGLVSADENEEKEEAKFFRDYEAEAEEELFGANGILSHYSDAPAGAAVSSTMKSTEVASVAAAPPRKATKAAAASPSPPTLLPFKEIGKRMKFSGEYCRRTCAQALTKLTRAAEEGRLAESDFLLGW